jgi:hypothetical protein
LSGEYVGAWTYTDDRSDDAMDLSKGKENAQAQVRQSISLVFDL